MVTLDYSHLTSVLLGGVQGLPGPAGRDGSLAGPAGTEEAEEAIRNMANARRETIKARLRGSPHRFRQHSADAAAGPGARPSISRGEVKAFLDGLRVNQDRPQRGNSFVPLEPMNQLQVDLADMRAFGGKPYPFMLVAIDALTKKVAAEPLKNRLASTTAADMKKVFQAMGVPANVDDGAEFKREFKADGFLGHREAGDQGPRLLCGAHHPHHQGGHVAPHSSRSGPAGAVAPHAGRHLEPNQRKEARYHAGGAEPRLL